MAGGLVDIGLGFADPGSARSLRIRDRLFEGRGRPRDRSSVRHQRGHRRHVGAREVAGVRPQVRQHLPLHLRHEVRQATF